MKILAIPDVHGRTFWKDAVEKHASEVNKIVFLGDYTDPYDFEDVDYEKVPDNLREIISFAKQNKRKVKLLLGNHDLPYFNDYYREITYPCRYMRDLADELHTLFDENRKMFKIAAMYDNILFTHAGVLYTWLECCADFYKIDFNDGKKLVAVLNRMLNSKKGITLLSWIPWRRGGDAPFGSVVWSDVREHICEVTNFKEYLNNPSEFKDYHPNRIPFKQVFGHTLQAFRKRMDSNKIIYGEPIEMYDFKMVDNTKAHIIDVENFTSVEA